MDSVHLITRWLHVLAGVMWIGQLASLTLVQQLTPRQPVSVTQGTFIRRANASIQRAAPWTWGTGFFLLGIVYYGGGALTHVDQSVGVARLAGIASLFVTWFVYDSVWMLLAKNGRTATLVSLVLFGAAAAGLTRIMTGRAAFIHLGAMLGTIIMVNGQQRIGPIEQQWLTSSEAGDPATVKRLEVAAVRMRHNVALAVAVIFFMISNHFPLVYGHTFGWILAPAVVLVGALMTRPPAGGPAIAREGRETIGPDPAPPRARA